MKQKIELENGTESDKRQKNIQYTLNMSNNNIWNNDLQIEDQEDIQNIDLKVFQYLIREQKMDFEEAIVLIIRERALILDFRDNLNNIELYSIDSHNSVRSKSVNSKMSVSLQKLVNRLMFRFNMKNPVVKEDMDDKMLKAEQNRK